MFVAGLLSLAFSHPFSSQPTETSEESLSLSLTHSLLFCITRVAPHCVNTLMTLSLFQSVLLLGGREGGWPTPPTDWDPLTDGSSRTTEPRI